MGLGFIACRTPFGPGGPPVDRPRRGPAEGVRGQEPAQRPAGIVVDVGGEAEFSAWPQSSGERLDDRFRDDATLVVAPLRPGVGIEHEDARKEPLRRGLEQSLDIAAPYPHVDQLFALDAGKRGRHAVQEGLAADEPNLRIALRLRNQMLARAEADFEPEFPRLERKKRA